MGSGTGGDRRAEEASQFLRRSLEPSLLLHQHPRAEICVNVLVLAADGGETSAALVAATTALIDAGVPIREPVVAVETALTEGGEVLVDPSGSEVSGLAASITVALEGHAGRVVGATLSARLPVALFEKLLRAGQAAGRTMWSRVEAAVRAETTEALLRRGAVEA